MSTMNRETCTKCNEPLVKQWGHCNGCFKPFHLACMVGQTRTQMRCESCAGLAQEEELPPPSSRFSVDLQKEGLSSTVVGQDGSAAAVIAMQRQMNEMREMMLSMQATILSLTREKAGDASTSGAQKEPAPTPTVPPAAANNEGETSVGNNTTVGLNKTQAAVIASIRANRIDKQEQEYRRSCDPLPIFNGDPTQWFVFFSTFKETTIQCGFSDNENMKRVKDALKDPARKRVQHLLIMPHDLTELMETLESYYGTPKSLVNHVTTMAMATASLKSDLSNISEFYGVARQINVALNLLDTPVEGPGLPELLVRKMDGTRKLEWVRFLNRRDSTMALFIEYLGELCRDWLQTEESDLPSTSRQETRQEVRVKKTPTANVLIHQQPSTHDEGPSQADAVQGKGSQDKRCICGCPSEHSLGDCPKFRTMTVKERWTVIKTHRRCACCFGRHYMAKCKRPLRCPYPGCSFNHHAMLHRETQDGGSQDGGSQDGGSESSPEKTAVVNLHRDQEMNTVYAVAEVTVRHNGRSARTYALLDTGSSTTFIRTGLARQLGLRGERTTMSVAWTDRAVHPLETERVELYVEGGTCERQRVSAWTMDELCLPTYTFTEMDAAREKFSSLPLTFHTGVVPQILMGLDNAELIMGKKTVVGSSQRIVATSTALGWVVMGQIEGDSNRRTLLVQQPRDDLQDMVEQYIEADHYVMEDQYPIRLSDENERALELLQTHTRWTGHRFEAPLLWASEEAQLPHNREDALRRHRGLVKQLERDLGMWGRLDKMMTEYLAKGYARVVADAATGSPREWFLPVFTVTNPHKPEKIRVVWDAAAKTKGISLNSQLLVGPDLNAPLVHVLLKLRCGRVAISGDIREMFHQIGVRENDRDSQKFFWQWTGQKKPVVMQMDVMTFGSACSPTAAQFVKNMNADRFQSRWPEAVAAIKERHYVDDYLDSRDTVEELLLVARQVQEIHRQGGFAIHKFRSNAKEVTRALGGDEEEIVEVSSTSTLGMNWHTSNDTLLFRWREDIYADVMKGKELPTKRQLLRMAMAIFDPMGLIGYITVLGRLLLREAWRTSTGWDDTVPEYCRPKWEEWLECLQRINHDPIPRWLGELGHAVDLHVFVDASDAAMGAVVYAVANGTVAMIMGKCNVAPLRTKSIPRLELDAAVMGVRLLELVRAARCWTVLSVHFWSDARDVLYWIRCHRRRYSPYVGNRVGTILRHSEVGQWHWTPTDKNPADWATKYVDHGGESTLWRQGPEFLKEDPSRWPESHEEPTEIKELVRILVVQKTNHNPLIPSAEFFSAWERMIRNVAAVYRFADICLRRVAKFKGRIDADEMRAAERLILIDVQLDLTEREKKEFAAFKDKTDLWRSRSRIALMPDRPYDERFPILLPRASRVTELIMDYYHRQSEHCLDHRALHSIKKRFIFRNSTSLLNAVVRKCMRCVLNRAMPLCPEMAPLPPCRLAVNMRPFSFTGTDLFGPLQVKIGRRVEKRYGIIFTCLTTRAVYLTLVYSLSALSCMSAMHEFEARRGPPLQYHSDNGTNYVATAKVHRTVDGERPRWVFNPPQAPHTGGAWERMIGITKRILNRMELEEVPTEERLRWFLAKAEFLINSRPLIDIGASDTAAALTPLDLLWGPTEKMENVEALKPEENLQVDEYWATRDADVQKFWKWWTDAYLPTLSTRPKWWAPSENVKIGDVVWICDGDYRRGWRKGRILEATLDCAGMQVRQVAVKTSDGSVYRRHVSKIAPIVK